MHCCCCCCWPHKDKCYWPDLCKWPIAPEFLIQFNSISLMTKWNLQRTSIYSYKVPDQDWSVNLPSGTRQRWLPLFPFNINYCWICSRLRWARAVPVLASSSRSPAPVGCLRISTGRRSQRHQHSMNTPVYSLFRQHVDSFHQSIISTVFHTN